MKKLNGFTIIELLVTISIGAILATMAVPSFLTMLENNRASSQVRDLISAFNLARGEAVTRGNAVSVCTSVNGTACVAAGNWENGWIVFSDLDADGVVDGGNCNNINTDDCVVRMWGATSGVDMTGGAAVITYNPDARAVAALAVTMTPNGCTTGEIRQINVNVSATGQVTSTRTTCP